MSSFVLTGVGGYIAPRHLQAIKDNGQTLLASHDLNDSVGILDRYFMGSAFFTNRSEFEKFVKENPVEWLSVCTPNFQHKPDLLFGLSNGLNVICEKPLVLTLEEWSEIKNAEEKYGKKVWTVLQLRYHSALKDLKKKVEANPNKRFQVELVYLTSRGPWYHKSWKGDLKKSGGLATNIGVHFFDMLTWVFGELGQLEVEKNTDQTVAGTLSLARADVKWKLSIDYSEIPSLVQQSGKTTFRYMKMDGEEIEFSDGFTDLHTVVYRDALAGQGFGLDETRAAIRIVEKIRSLA